MEKNKLLYIVFQAVNKQSGIQKKISSQINSLNNLGFDTTLSYLSVDSDNKYSGRQIGNSIHEKYKRSLFFAARWKWRIKFSALVDYCHKEGVNVVYIRYIHNCNPFFLNFLKRIRKRNILILLEIPTYPYDNEYFQSKLVVRLAKWVESYCRRFMRYYVHRVVTFSDDKVIFGIPTLQIDNATSIIKPRNIKFVKERKIDLIAVSSMLFWHGYDRLLEGLHLYYSNKPIITVVFHVVGDINTIEAIRYKKLVKEYNLDNYVVFYGFLSNNELDSVFENSDIGIGCLGIHRKGIQSCKSLKNREYCARGIPFIYSESDPTFDNQEFVYRVSHDDSPIDVKAIVDFYRKLKYSSNEIAAFAENNLTWDKQMSIISTWISSQEHI